MKRYNEEDFNHDLDWLKSYGIDESKAYSFITNLLEVTK